MRAVGSLCFSRACLLGLSLCLPLSLTLACTGKPSKVDDTGTGTGTTTLDDGKLRVTILHTNDLHSHLTGFGPDAEFTPDTTGDDLTLGGVARIKTLADEIRNSVGHPVLMMDAGDWMDGALFQLLSTTDAAELQAFQALNYDVTTFGNHEFDWGPDVLGQIVAAGDASGVTVPILAANTVPDSTDPADDALEALFDSGRVQDNVLFTLDNGLVVGVTGLLGDEAAGITPAAVPTTFSPIAEVATDQVAALRAQGADLVVALTHAGVTDDPATSPDEVLANAAPGIDVIVGGHSHTALQDYRTANGTVIVQAGYYGMYLGQLDLAYDGTSWEVEGYQLHIIDDLLQGDPDVSAMVDGFVADLESGPMADMGHDFAEPILSVPDDIAYGQCTESAIGNFVTDAYQQTINSIAGVDPIDVAFETQGVLRDGLLKGQVGIQGFSDIFRVLPLGSGMDDRPGYPLVDFYVTAGELADACEVSASVSPFFGCNYFVEHSGMRCTVDMVNTPFARVQKIELWQGGAWVDTDFSATNTELYHVTVDSYTASLMYTLEDLTSGLLVITPKDATGTPYSNLDDAIFDADSSTDGVQELKLWEALVDYAQTMPDNDGDGVPDLDSSYVSPAGRLVGFDR